MVTYIPDRGDIVWLSFDPQVGKEMKKTRPALTISPKIYNLKSGLALFMPITSVAKDYPFEVSFHQTKIHGVILADQIKSLDWRLRNATFIAKCKSAVVNDAIEKFNVLILDSN